MFEKEMTLIYEKKKIWRNILLHFGCPIFVCDDMVSDMYLKVLQRLKAGANIMYNEKEINYFYIYKILRSLYYDKTRKDKDYYLVGLAYLVDSEADIDNSQYYEMVESELKAMYWYDRKVFEIVTSGESILQLSQKTKISYYSLYRTFNKVKKQLKKLL
tara:strand:- start:90 stop:566 length:477 start_codon:yes stop_codon:yes gene_type:complete